MTAEPSVQPSVPVTGQLLQPAVDLARWSAGMLCTLLWCAALVVAWRRLAGALSQPLAPETMLVVGIMVATVALAVRFLGHRFPLREKPSRVALLMSLSPTLAVLVLGAALSLPATATMGFIAFWSLVAAEELWAWRPLVWRGRRRAGSLQPVRIDPPEAPPPHPSPAKPSTSASSTTAPEAMPLLSPATIPDGDVLQQLTRSQADDGSEQVSGWLRMPLCVGQRTASIHVAFCPPFPKTPTLEVEQFEGPEARIKTAQLLPHGVRLDLKLRHAAEEPVDVLLQFSARSP